MAYQSREYRRQLCGRYLEEQSAWVEAQKKMLPQRGKLTPEQYALIDALLAKVRESTTAVLKAHSTELELDDFGYELVPVYMDAYDEALKVLERSGKVFWELACFSSDHRSRLTAFFEEAHTRDDAALRSDFAGLTFDGKSPLLRRLLEQLMPGARTGVRPAAPGKTVFGSWRMQQLATTKQHGAAVGHLLLYYLLNCIVPADRDPSIQTISGFVEFTLFNDAGDRRVLEKYIPRGLSKTPLRSFLQWVQMLPRMQLAHAADARPTPAPPLPGGLRGLNPARCDAALAAQAKDVKINMSIVQALNEKLEEFKPAAVVPYPLVTDDFLRLYATLVEFGARLLALGRKHAPTVEISHNAFGFVSDAVRGLTCDPIACAQARRFVEHHFHMLQKETFDNIRVLKLKRNDHGHLWDSQLIQDDERPNNVVARLMYHLIAMSMPNWTGDPNKDNTAAMEADSKLFEGYPFVAALLAQVAGYSGPLPNVKNKALARLPDEIVIVNSTISEAERLNKKYAARLEESAEYAMAIRAATAGSAQRLHFLKRVWALPTVRSELARRTALTAAPARGETLIDAARTNRPIQRTPRDNGLRV